ncbi:MAG: SemiSWEET family transporter [Desulfobacteraceae bacterium]|jgi:MtN3 and saliva related transmembrane protein
MASFDILGYAAGFLTTFSAAPQLVHAYRVKDLRSIDMKFQLMLLSGLALWTLYGITIKSLPVIIFNLIGFSLWVPIFWMKIRERRAR